MARSAVLGLCLALALPAAAVAAAEEETRRDPFLFGPRAAYGVLRGPTLIGVLWDATSPLAIVGDRTVAVGDRVDVWTVAEIRPDRVVIEYAGRQEEVRTGRRFPSP